MTVRRPPVPVGGALSSLGLVGLAPVGGCTGGTDGPGTPPTAAGRSSASAAATDAEAPVYELPTSCADVVRLSQVDEALGTVLAGDSSFTEGSAEPGIGRTGRVTCGFGISPATDTSGAGDPPLELSVFSYTDVGAAADPVEAIVAAQEAQGARSEQLTVADAPGVLLSTRQDTTLVVTVQARTCSPTLLPGILDAAATSVALRRLMADVLASDAPEDAAGASSGATG
ncbi:MAG TPA: hypothetical protein VGO95_07720 [Modestobacter sp.]|nr:hypothetical protein [Modestobacter sp.]